MEDSENITGSDYTILTALEFNKILSTDYKGVKEKDGRCFWEERTLQGKCVVFNKIKIVQDLIIEYKKNKLSLFIRNSELGNIQISEYTHREFGVSNSKIRSLRIEDSSIEDFKVKNATADYLFINTSTIFNFTLNKFNISSLIKIEKSSITFADFKKVKLESFSCHDIVKIGGLTLRESAVSEFTISKESKIAGLNLNNSNVDKEINIFEESLLGNTWVDNSKISIINAYESTLNFIHFDSKSEHQTINYKKSTIGECIFLGSKGTDLSIENCTIGNIEFNNVTFSGTVEIKKKSILLNLSLQGKELKRIKLEDIFIKIFNWKQDSFCVLNIERCNIVTLNFENCIIPKDSVLQIINCNVNKLNCLQLVNTAWLTFSNLQPLESYLNYGKVITTKKTEEIVEQNEIIGGLLSSNTPLFISHLLDNQTSTINISNSDLSRTSFIDCRLDKFSEFYFYNSKLLDIFIAGTTFPTVIKVHDNNELKEQSRFAFAQFKRVYENRGDNVRANEFLALELETYRQQLKNEANTISKKYNGRIKKYRSKDWLYNKQNRINLFINRLSSDYGNNWLRAAGITLMVNFFCFTVYCVFLYGIGSDYEKPFELFTYGLEFLNPIRKADFLKESGLSYNPNFDFLIGLGRIWDYLSRICIAYLSYQTIQAFRRFGKVK